MRIVRIEWEGPYDLEEALTLRDEEEDYGVYQVYGEHVVFGEDALLYIGNARDQPFGRRLYQHDWIDDYHKIFVGRIADADYKHDPPDWDDWYELLQDVEALEIYWHTPPYNSHNIKGYYGRPLIIINEGQRAKLSAGCESDEIPYYNNFAYIIEDAYSVAVSKESGLEGVTVAIRSSCLYRERFLYKERWGYFLQKTVF